MHPKLIADLSEISLMITGDDDLVIAVRPWRLACYHLNNSAAQAPDISATAISHSSDNLWCHVVTRATQSLVFSARRQFYEPRGRHSIRYSLEGFTSEAITLSSCAKVCNFYCVLLHAHVLLMCKRFFRCVTSELIKQFAPLISR